jgi:KUP system potassium uptake protein
LGIIVGQPDGSVDSYMIYNPYDHSILIRSNVVRLEVTGSQLALWLGTREKMALARTPFHYVEGAILDFQRVAENDPNESEFNLRGPLYDSDETSENMVRGDSDIDQRIARKRIDYRNGVPGIDFDNHRRTRSTQNQSSSDQDSSSDPQAVQYVLQIDSPILLQHCGAVKMRTEDSPTVRRALDVMKVDRNQWRDAIRVEIKQLFDRGTLEHVDERDPDRRSRVIRSTMQLKLKRNQDGSINKYKARCCASGDQLENEEFKTFSPTISSPAMFVMLQTAIIDQMLLLTIDVVGAYLYQDYPESNLPLYMSLQREVAEVCDLNPDHFYRIRKYLYGLPDAGRAFYEAYAEHLINNGYQRSMSDPCLFIRITSDGNRTYLCIHVDDTFVASTSETELILLQKILKQRFEITCCKTIDSYLGIQIQKLADGSVKLSQPKLISGLVLQYGHLFSGRTPMTPMKVDSLSSDSALQDHDKFDYLHLLGGMMYLLKSRPDIGAALSFAATKSTKPTEHDFQSLLHCLHYLEATRDLGLLLSTGTPGQDLILTCYVDASYLTHSDSRSHHGWTLSLGTFGCFHSKSKKQSIVATSSTHAEMRGVFELAEDIVFVLQLHNELGRPIKLPAIIFEDNQPVIDLLAESHGRTNKSRHFLMIIEYVRQLVAEGLVAIRKIPSEKNPADILTKAVTGRDFAYKRQQLLGLETGVPVVIPVANPRARRLDEASLLL